ncbi:MAG TPA: hypothetical protein PKV71_15960, partial [Calditrichia bacterium]|nr:hypothetical protein [Calditrichia bacterium]
HFNHLTGMEHYFFALQIIQSIKGRALPDLLVAWKSLAIYFETTTGSPKFLLTALEDCYANRCFSGSR